MTSDEGLNAYRRGDLGPVLHLPGLQRARRLDAHLHRRRQRRRVRRDHRRPRRRACSIATARRPGRSRRAAGRPSPTARRTARSPSGAFTVYATHHGPIVRAAGGKWIAIALMNTPVAALEQSFLRTKATRLRELRQGRRAARPTPATTPCSPTTRARSPCCIRSSCPGATTASTTATRSTAPIRRPTGRGCTRWTSCPRW